MANRLVRSELSPAHTIELNFPVKEPSIVRTAHTRTPEETIYTIRIRGNTVVDISPRDERPTVYPRCQRDGRKGTKAPVRKAKRLVSNAIARW